MVYELDTKGLTTPNKTTNLHNGIKAYISKVPEVKTSETPQSLDDEWWQSFQACENLHKPCHRALYYGMRYFNPCFFKTPAVSTISNFYPFSLMTVKKPEEPVKFTGPTSGKREEMLRMSRPKAPAKGTPFIKLLCLLKKKHHRHSVLKIPINFSFYNPFKLTFALSIEINTKRLAGCLKILIFHRLPKSQ